MVKRIFLCIANFFLLYSMEPVEEKKATPIPPLETLVRIYQTPTAYITYYLAVFPNASTIQCFRTTTAIEGTCIYTDTQKNIYHLSPHIYNLIEQEFLIRSSTKK